MKLLIEAAEIIPAGLFGVQKIQRNIQDIQTSPTAKFGVKKEKPF